MVELDTKATGGPECNELARSEKGVVTGKDLWTAGALHAGAGWECHGWQCWTAIRTSVIWQTKEQCSKKNDDQRVGNSEVWDEAIVQRLACSAWNGHAEITIFQSLYGPLLGTSMLIRYI